jgi:Zn-dependent protease
VENPYEGTFREYARPNVTQARTRVFWFSPTELKHLAIAALLVMGVGISLFIFSGINVPASLTLLVLVSLAVMFTCSFLLHELAHKITAQHFGLWAEFRLTTFGAILTLISIISPLKFISPGAVMIAGSGSRESIGKTSIAGPSTNLVLSTIFLWIAFLPLGYISLIALIGSYINAFIALFNLIPFAIFDGQKVFAWNKAVWAVAFLLSLALFIPTFIIVYPIL